MSDSLHDGPRRIICLTEETTETLYLLGEHNPARVLERPGWDALPAVHNGWLSEIKSCAILQPGPAALTDGLSQLQRIIAAAAAPPGP
jgi:ABC-type Fe3+-hydroxamate transport system substrate-binding protein